MTRTYLIQHAKAFDKDIDEERPLTPEGKVDIEKVSMALKEKNIEIREIYHSGKTRAFETAQIIQKNLSPNGEIVKHESLSPLDDVSIVGNEIKENKVPKAYVGHLPHLEKLVGYLICGDPKTKVVEFKNGGIVCLEHQEDLISVHWILTPEIA